VTLADFLLARIADDEAAAAHAKEALGWTDSTSVQIAGREFYDPARVLAECEAKRRIVEANSGSVRAKRDAPKHTVRFDGDGRTIEMEGLLLSLRLSPEQSEAFMATWYEPVPPNATLCALASVYADHPDYREEWRP